MITVETRLRINDDEIAAEIIDGEAVLINLGTGMYYTLAGTGCEMWAFIERQLSLAEMRDALASRYGVEPAVVLGDLMHLARQLVDEGLVRMAEAAAVNGSTPTELRPDPAGYAPPKMERYTDMAEILALDPPLPVLKDDA